MKLSEYKGDDALELLANILEPASEIIGDAEVKEMFTSKAPLLKVVKVILKNHKREVTEILAYLDGEDPETYEVGFMTLPIKLLQILQDKELLAVFQSQVQITADASSGSAMENTEETEAE
jgi:hypothetical protein